MVKSVGVQEGGRWRGVFTTESVREGDYSRARKLEREIVRAGRVRE